MTTAIVTGATSGVGLECAVSLARKGMRVVVVARGREKGEPAVAQVRERSGASPARVTLETCEMGSLAEVRSLAQRLLAHNERIDLLINNAGLVAYDRRVTVDGFEQTFAVNHLAPYLLTRLLLDRIVATARSTDQNGDVRIVNVSSKSHHRGTMDFDDLHYAKRYFILSAYERSKLANVLFTLELARRVRDDGVVVQAMHPGRIASDIWQRAPWFARPFLALRRMDSAARGGARLVHAATSPEARETGGYWSDEKRVPPSKLAQDAGVARKLWDVSAHLVGLPA